jgi:hypothetical protein
MREVSLRQFSAGHLPTSAAPCMRSTCAIINDANINSSVLLRRPEIERERERTKKSGGKSSNTLIRKLSPYTLSVYIALCSFSMTSGAIFLWYIMDTLESISGADRKYHRIYSILCLTFRATKECVSKLISVHSSIHLNIAITTGNIWIVFT